MLFCIKPITLVLTSYCSSSSVKNWPTTRPNSWTEGNAAAYFWKKRLPTICNFPIIDAVLPPAMGLQMTTSHTHTGSITRLPEILGALKIAAQDFTVVFVVPEDVLPGFSFPSNLGAVKMYVTVPTAVTRDAFEKLNDRKRKWVWIEHASSYEFHFSCTLNSCSK